MSLHIFGAVVTANGCAANNRGETAGNITTLQKLLWNDNVHTTVSAEAIRWALRYYWQMETPDAVNRKWNDEKEDHQWQDPNWSGWETEDGETYIDDDVLGFMKAEGAKTDGEEIKDTKKTSKKRSKGTINKRRGVLEFTRAVSTTPYVGDITFNAKSGEKERTSLYGTEMHATRYQYAFAMTPQRLRVKDRCIDALDGIISLGEVAGNHSRFLFDFSPESIVMRVTEDPAPRLLFCFHEENNTVSAPELVRKVISNDIPPQELFIGGKIAETPEILNLNATICVPGVREAAEKCKENIKERLSSS